MLALTFQVGPEWVAVDVRRVRGVVPRVRLVPPAGGPPHLAGVFVHRGRVVPVIDLCRLSGVGECPQRFGSRIILVPQPGSDTGAVIGLLAARVAELRELPDPAGDVGLQNGSLFGPAVADGSGVVRVLDPERFLTQPVFAAGLPSGVSRE
jgi:chemotaxis-related protein WspB